MKYTTIVHIHGQDDVTFLRKESERLRFYQLSVFCFSIGLLAYLTSHRKISQYYKKSSPGKEIGDERKDWFLF